MDDNVWPEVLVHFEQGDQVSVISVLLTECQQSLNPERLYMASASEKYQQLAQWCAVCCQRKS